MDEKIKAAFDSVHADNLLKQKTAAAVKGKMKISSRSKRWTAAIAACLLIAVCAAGGFLSYTTPVAAISIDDDQSVELGINMFDKVIKVKQYGSGGDNSICTENIKNKDYTEAINIILSYCQTDCNDSSEDTWQVTVACKSGEKMEEIKECINKLSCVPQQNIYCMENMQDMKAAEEAGISAGKYRVYLELLKIYPGLTVEEIRNMSMKQLRSMAEQDTNTSGQNGNGTQDGNGAQNGYSSQNGYGTQRKKGNPS